MQTESREIFSNCTTADDVAFCLPLAPSGEWGAKASYKKCFTGLPGGAGIAMGRQYRSSIALEHDDLIPVGCHVKTYAERLLLERRSLIRRLLKLFIAIENQNFVSPQRVLSGMDLGEQSPPLE